MLFYTYEILLGTDSSYLLSPSYTKGLQVSIDIGHNYYLLRNIVNLFIMLLEVSTGKAFSKDNWMNSAFWFE